MALELGPEGSLMPEAMVSRLGQMFEYGCADIEMMKYCKGLSVFAENHFVMFLNSILHCDKSL